MNVALTSIFITRWIRWVSFRRATNSPILRVSKKNLGKWRSLLKNCSLIRVLKSLACKSKKYSLTTEIPMRANNKKVSNSTPWMSLLTSFEGRILSMSFWEKIAIAKPKTAITVPKSPLMSSRRTSFWMRFKNHLNCAFCCVVFFLNCGVGVSVRQVLERQSLFNSCGDSFIIPLAGSPMINIPFSKP